MNIKDIIALEEVSKYEEKLINIDNRFKSAYPKVYGAITIDYHDIDKEKLNELLIKMINLKDED